MKDASANITHLKDYRKPDFNIKSVALCFKLFEDGAEVQNTMMIERCASDVPLCLDGEHLELREIKLNGEVLGADAYNVSNTQLVIHEVSDRFELKISTWIQPHENKSLEGLYKSSAMFCTQCEAEGFRRITYYLDRPDVLSVFTTRIEADKRSYPLLLSNGNQVDSGELDDNRHFAVWRDPHPKPCYLFALVAGNLHCQEDSFSTMSGRDVTLQIFVEPKNASKCDYALDALKRSMKWDEDVYGREYDLDIFMIVAVDDFNMGAMENKGLNIFNSSCVLAKPDTTTDAAYQRIEAIVAHEYFHNWSGNRVTCRDWFQLSLKEGFTVFRDSEFSADMNSRIVKRIEDVNLLRSAQFAEDAGPMSHPVRPSSYMEISNFYTLTVYEKGAELVRMIHTLLGPDLFRKGSDLYFDRHDGQAVTTEDFVAAMSEVSGRDLFQFKRWYEQSGTPVVDVSGAYDAEAQTFTLHFEQSCPATPKQDAKLPFHIPITLGLIDKRGNDIPLSLFEGRRSATFEMTEQKQSLCFEGVADKPIPSLLRGFSSPVKLNYPYLQEDLLFMMSHDSDGFNRWDAGQKLALNELLGMIDALASDQPAQLSREYVAAMETVLSDRSLDKSMVCKMLMLPTEGYLIEQMEMADVDVICKARKIARRQLSSALRSALYLCYKENSDAEQGGLTYSDMSRRALKNSCLGLLAANSDPEFVETACKQYDNAGCMTDQFAALSAIVHSGSTKDADDLLQRFYSRWKDDAQVMDTWFSVQAGCSDHTDLAAVKKLMQHDAFEFYNPNKLRSVVGVFASQNLVNFHNKSGLGYRFLADQIILLDDANPQIASRLTTPLTRWKKFDLARQALMLEELKRVHAKPGLSKDLREVIEKSLP